mmetsp:Transcript_24068/g.23136  ORF Transcript_24068/g.23136 Transcript_24068/m.23136 type:complete len:201 (+) Transcript_24068:89-691(+)
MFILDSIVLLSLFSITLSFSLTAQKTCVKNSFTIKRECLFSSPSDDSLFSGPRNDKTFGPSCVIVAGLAENHLETIDDIFTASLGILPPVIILSDKDFNSKMSFRKLFNDPETLKTRDHALAAKECKLSGPVIIFSGCDRLDVRGSILAYKTWDAPSGKLPKAAFAVVVEKSMDKNVKDLCEEILNDFQTEQMIRAVGGG